MYRFKSNFLGHQVDPTNEDIAAFKPGVFEHEGHPFFIIRPHCFGGIRPPSADFSPSY
ncbi:hypothetical protein [Geobacillus sp. 47C-IIb]|uniref:hypothetical protein n=1 Tax=Geobacillus sp. 47C-IIb TaxID=1963026 RepID=UPI001680D466|nr:hypothetical protein [Geobacillus sp. 47C-IIb]QNU32650.1 hypothetical protein IC804_08230 [Geobacillus sp. 47C-IIb]